MAFRRRCYKTEIQRTENLQTDNQQTENLQTDDDNASNPKSEKTLIRDKTNQAVSEVRKDKTGKTCNKQS